MASTDRPDDDSVPQASPLRPTAPVTHLVGQDLGPLSVAEIDTRIALLETEITRLREARTAKEAVKRAADSLFRL